MKKILHFSISLFFSIQGFSQAFLPLTSGTNTSLVNINFVNANVGFVVGINGVILNTTNAGVNWTQQVSGVTTDLTDVAFVDVNTGYVVGRSGVILKTIHGGTGWSVLTSSVSTDLTRIFINGS